MLCVLVPTGRGCHRAERFGEDPCGVTQLLLPLQGAPDPAAPTGGSSPAPCNLGGEAGTPARPLNAPKHEL